MVRWVGVWDCVGYVEWLFMVYTREGDSATGLPRSFLGGKPWLAPLSLALLAPLLVLRKPKNDPLFARVLLVAGGGGLAYLLCQAFAIGLNGWQFGFLGSLFGPLDKIGRASCRDRVWQYV